MKKVVCPECGGPLILESLCQYGRQQELCKNGKIKKKIKVVDQGPIDFQHIFCESCHYVFGEGEFISRDGCVELLKEARK